MLWAQSPLWYTRLSSRLTPENQSRQAPYFKGLAPVTLGADESGGWRRRQAGADTRLEALCFLFQEASAFVLWLFS